MAKILTWLKRKERATPSWTLPRTLRHRPRNHPARKIHNA